LPLGGVARLNGQYVERTPAAGELFSKGAHDATGTFEIGIINLKEEKAGTIKLGLKRPQGALRFDANAFYTKFDGFIFKQRTGIKCGGTLASCGTDDELDQVVFQTA
jgi:iron complex outermembrane receptor protein